MIDWTLWAAFMLASWTMCLVPGPAVAYAVSATSQLGPRAGFTAITANAIGILTHSLVAATLLSYIVQHPEVFEIIRYAGGAFLIYLGLRIFAQERRQSRGKSPAGKIPFKGSIFREALGVSLMNPKVAVTMLALTTQFIRPELGWVKSQVVFLGASHAINASITISLWVLMTTIAIRKQEAGESSSWIRYGSGALLCLLGGKMVLI